MRITGVVYDWDLWPERVAVGEVGWRMYWLGRNLAEVQRAIGLALYPAVRDLSRRLAEAMVA